MRSRKGFLLVSVLVMSLALLLLIVGAAVTSLLQRQVAAEQRGATEAYFVAKAGMEHFKVAALWALAESGQGWTGDPEAACGLPIQGGIEFGTDIELLPSTASATNVVTFTLGADGATYDLSYNVAGPLILLRSVGHVGTSQATVQVIAGVGEGPANIWDNAVTAGTLTPGAEGGLAGTIAVYGSIHIIAGDATVDADVDLTGNAGVFNNYLGKGLTSATYVQDVINELLASDELRYQDLCTSVKMKEGNLEVGNLNSAAGTRVGAGSEHVGVTGSIWGIFLNYASGDHFVTSKGTPVDPLAEPYIFVRNPVADYEPFGLESLPSLAGENYPPALISGTTVHTVTGENCAWVVGGELSLPPSADGSTCAADDGTPLFSWDASTDTLVVSPNEIRFVAFPDADLDVAGDMHYDGITSWWFGGPTHDASVVVRGSMTPRDGDFLTTSGFGIVANDRIELGAKGGDVVFAGLAFAGSSLEVNKQVTVVGAVVGTTVTMSQVPRIAHNRAVGPMAQLLGMPGADGVQAPGVFRVLSEERR